MRHIGYAVVDIDGDVFINDDMIEPKYMDESLANAIRLQSCRDLEFKKYSPHRVVRILIDEIEDDKND